MIELAVDSLAPLPGVMTLVVVAFTVSGLVLKVTVGALSVPPTVMTSRALAAEVSVLPEPHAAKNTKGMTAADTTRKRGRLSLIHISEPTRLGMISYAVFCLK